MAENKKSFTAKIITIIEEEMKFSEKFGIQYFEQSTFSKIENILSQMRRMMVISGDEYHILFSNYQHLYKNFIKYKHLISKNGLNEIENLQTLCKSCNSRKRDNIIDYRTKS